ncbi:MAG TPA: RidA family protein [Gemmatimonadales bacterium]|nr:RidA family protein [Gemmatimonadales bacterium]
MRNATLALMTLGALGLVDTPAIGQGRAGPGGRTGGGFDPTATRYINPGTLAGLDGFTHAVRVGQMVYVSGEVALDSVGGLVGPGDLAAQARQAFANLELVLDIAGVSPSDVIQLNVYVVGLKAGDWATIRGGGAKFFPQRNPPAGTVLGVAALPREGLLIAVDAVAVIKANFRPLRDDRGAPPED